MTFDDDLARGESIEDAVAAQFFAPRGWAVIRAKNLGPQEAFRGPFLTGPMGQKWSLPDFLATKGATKRWCEIKGKGRFTWHRITRRWTTGIDLAKYGDYLAVSHHTGLAVWLLFVHEESTPSDEDCAGGSPPRCPTGWFTQSLSALRQCENHRHANWGRSGMVYWARESFQQVWPGEKSIPEETLQAIGESFGIRY